MNVTRTAVVALIAFSGVAIPTAGAAQADGDPPLLCGLLNPCDATTSSGDGTETESEGTPVDVDVDLDLAVGVDLSLGVPNHDLDTDVAGDVAGDADLQLFPSKGTLLTASADVPSATAQASAFDHTVDAATDAALDTDVTVGHGVVATANGAANTQAAINVAGRQLLTADAAERLCGVQVVIAAASSADCRSSGSGNGSQASGNGLIAVAESIDLCGAHVVVAGSAATDCGDSSANGSPAMGSSWTLVGTAVEGTLCGASVAIAGRSSTSCPGAAQEAPVPGPDPNGSGTGTPGTGATPPNAGGNTGGSVGGVASSPAAQPQQAGDGDGDAAGESSGSLPLTGASLLMVLLIASASLAAGLVAMRSSRVRLGHQS